MMTNEYVKKGKEFEKIDNRTESLDKVYKYIKGENVNSF